MAVSRGENSGEHPDQAGIGSGYYPHHDIDFGESEPDCTNCRWFYLILIELDSETNAEIAGRYPAITVDLIEHLRTVLARSPDMAAASVEFKNIGLCPLGMLEHMNSKEVRLRIQPGDCRPLDQILGNERQLD